MDYRRLNVTKPDAEADANVKDLYADITTAKKYFSKIDLSKGYWQIPFTEATKERLRS